MSQVTKFNSTNIINNLKEKIRETLINIIPEEEWENLIKQEIHEFFKLRTNNYHQRNISDFTMTVNSVLTEMAKEKALLLLTKYLQETDFDSVENKTLLNNEILEKFIEKNNLQFFSVAVKDITYQAISNALASMQTKQYRQF